MKEEVGPHSVTEHQEDWTPIGAFFRAVAVEKLIEMGWLRTDAEAKIAKSEANSQTLDPIIEKLRGHRLYRDRGDKLSDVEQKDRTSEDNQPALALSECQKALGAAHFQIKDLIHDGEIRVRATVTKRSLSEAVVERHAEIPEAILIDPSPIRRKDGKKSGPIPDYDRDSIVALWRREDNVLVEVNEIELLFAAEWLEKLFPADREPPKLGSITLKYGGNPLAAFQFGARRATVRLNRNIAALVCVLVRGGSSWTRWDLLDELAQRTLLQKINPDEIVAAAASQKKDDEYREAKERVQGGLVAELSHLAAECPWLYGHLGSLNRNRPRALSIDRRGKGIHYGFPTVWMCEMSLR